MLIKREVRQAGEEEDWKKKTRDRGGWKRLADEAVKRCGQHITANKGKRGKERGIHCVDIHFRPSMLRTGFIHEFPFVYRGQT